MPVISTTKRKICLKYDISKQKQKQRAQFIKTAAQQQQRRFFVVCLVVVWGVVAAALLLLLLLS